VDGNFVDNHDEFSRIAHYCQKDTNRIMNALAWLLLTRGTPIVYYGTEQGLQGHQENINVKVHRPESPYIQFSSQARVRESLWQTNYNTSTWQYKWIATLNRLRKKYRITVGEQTVQFAKESVLIFTRTSGDGSKVWVFLNNIQNSDAREPISYCPGPLPSTEGKFWTDAISGLQANLSNGCFMAGDAFPKILVQMGSGRLAEQV
jgi:glycosidase